MSETRRILLVGHCGPDTFMLRNAVQRFVPGAEVDVIASDAELEGAMRQADLLLVNRVLDGRFDAGMGVDLIERVRGQRPDGPAAILVSNFADAQRAAEEAGAMPGFGKNDLYDPATGEKLRAALDAAESA